MDEEQDNKPEALKPDVGQGADLAHDADAAQRVAFDREIKLRAQTGEISAATAPYANATFFGHGGFGASETEKKKEEEKEFERSWQWALQQAIRQNQEMIDQYRNMADWYHKDAAKAVENMGKLAAVMDDASEKIKAVDDIEDEQRRTGHLDRDKAKKLLGIDPNEDVSDTELDKRLKKFKEDEQQRKAEASRQYDKEQARKDYDDTQEAENRRKQKEAEARQQQLEGEWDKIRQKDRAQAENFKQAADKLQNDDTKTPEQKTEDLKMLVKSNGIQATADAAKLETDKKRSQADDEAVKKFVETGKTVDKASALFDSDDDTPAASKSLSMQKPFAAAVTPPVTAAPVSEAQLPLQKTIPLNPNMNV